MKFNENQLKAINSINGNYVVSASAGSGKTSVLVERIVNMINNHNINPSNILAITFSKKAKDNMINRLQKQLGEISNQINIETFHSCALKIIQSTCGYNKYEVWTNNFEKEKVLFNICKKLKLETEQDEVPYNEINHFISSQKTLMKKPNDKKLKRIDDLTYSFENLVEIYKEYEKYKNQHNYIEFDDFLNIVCDLFKNKTILSQYQNIFKYILVDEFQDVSLNNMKFIELLGKTNNNVFIVGDILQAIYGFRGSDSSYMVNFKKNWNAEFISLNTNYRCSKDIVLTGNKLAESTSESKTDIYVESIANKTSNIKPIYKTFITPFDESVWIAKDIKKKIDSKLYKYNDIAILSRTNFYLQNMQLGLNSQQIKFNIQDSVQFFDLPEIKLLVSYLRLAENDYDNEAYEYIYNKPNRWLSKAFLAEVNEYAQSHCNSRFGAKYSLLKCSDKIARRNWRFKNGIDEIFKVIDRLRTFKCSNVSQLIKELRNMLPIDKFVSKGKQNDDGNFKEQIENMDNFQSICEDYKTIKDLLNYINNFKNNNIGTDDEKINLMTIHKSKGLEFKLVYIVGVSESLLPHSRCTDINEERRLFYVGITRAENELYISSTLTIRNYPTEISRFIYELEDTINDIDTVLTKDDEDNKTNITKDDEDNKTNIIKDDEDNKTNITNDDDEDNKTNITKDDEDNNIINDDKTKEIYVNK